MRHLTALLSGILLCLPMTIFAAQAPADTIGMRISRTHQTTQTTVYIKQSLDSIVKSDSLEDATRITVVTHDTIRRKDTVDRIDTTYFVAAPPANPWRFESRSEIAMTQIFRTDHWARGGGNMFSILLSNRSSAVYSRKFSTWRTELDFRYGMERQDRGEDINPWFKTQDRLTIESRYGFRASPHWNYTGLFQFSTQLTESFASATSETVVSRFLSPARFTFSIGMEYVSTTVANAPHRINLFFSPIAYRATYVRDVELGTRFGVPEGEHWLSTFGPMAMLENRHQLTPDLLLRSRLEPFVNLLAMHESHDDGFNSFFTVDWKLNLDIRLSRLLTFGFELWWIYDPTVWFNIPNAEPDALQRTRAQQFQQTLMLRLVYQWGR